MGLLSKKVGLVMGLANDHSIAWALSEALYAAGAELAFTHLPSPSNERRVRNLVEPKGAKMIYPCDVQNDEDIIRTFDMVKATYGRLDFLVHSIAFAPPKELKNPYMNMSRAGWHLAMDISVYQPRGGLPGRDAPDDRWRIDPHRQLLWRREGRAGLQRDGHLQGGAGAQCPLSGLGPWQPEHPRERHLRRSDADAQFGGHFALRQDAAARLKKSPLGRDVEMEDLGNTGVYLLSHLSAGVTGEILHVDCGYNIIGL